MDPASLIIGNHTLGAKDKAICLGIIEFMEDLSDLFLGVPGRRLHSPAGEDLISVMSAVVMVVMMVTVGFIDPVAVFINFHFRVFMIVVMVMMVFVLLIFVIVVVMMVVMVLMLLIFIIVVMVMMVLVLFFLFLLLAHEFLEDLSLQVASSFYRGEDLLAVKFRKRSRDDRCLRIVLAKDLYALSDLRLACLVGSCENDLRMIVPAHSIWLTKNSPKFFM